MMTLDRFVCSACGTDVAAGPSPAHWNAFVAAHINCDSAPQHPDRITAHEAEIHASEEKWILRILVGVVCAILMGGMALAGAHPWQWAATGCVFFCGLLYFFEAYSGVEK